MTKLEIHVGGGFAASKKRVLGAVARRKAGRSAPEDHITFDSWETLAGLMTTKRFELLRHLRRQPEVSVAALARSLRRDYKRVHNDVEALSQAGLIDRGDAGLRADYDEIRTRIAL